MAKKFMPNTHVFYGNDFLFEQDRCSHNSHDATATIKHIVVVVVVVIRNSRRSRRRTSYKYEFLISSLPPYNITRPVINVFINHIKYIMGRITTFYFHTRVHIIYKHTSHACYSLASL